MENFLKRESNLNKSIPSKWKNWNLKTVAKFVVFLVHHSDIQISGQFTFAKDLVPWTWGNCHSSVTILRGVLALPSTTTHVPECRGGRDAPTSRAITVLCLFHGLARLCETPQVYLCLCPLMFAPPLLPSLNPRKCSRPSHSLTVSRLCETYILTKFKPLGVHYLHTLPWNDWTPILMRTCFPVLPCLPVWGPSEPLYNIYSSW